MALVELRGMSFTKELLEFKGQKITYDGKKRRFRNLVTPFEDMANNEEGRWRRLSVEQMKLLEITRMSRNMG